MGHTPVMPSMVSSDHHLIAVCDMSGEPHRCGGNVRSVLAKSHHPRRWNMKVQSFGQFNFKSCSKTKADATIKLITDSTINIGVSIAKNIRQETANKIDIIISINVIAISSIAMRQE